MAAPGPLTTALGVAAVGAALAGCGDDEEDAPGPPVTVTGVAGVEVVAGEYFFDPESIVVEGGGGSIEITLENRGAIAHNLRVFEGETDIGGTPTFPGGQERSGRVDLEPGAYRMVCTVADHEALGMVGDLEVR